MEILGIVVLIFLRSIFNTSVEAKSMYALRIRYRINVGRPTMERALGVFHVPPLRAICFAIFTRKRRI